MPRFAPVRSIRVVVVPLALVSLLAVGAGSRPPALELGESRPAETSLGNPALRDARELWVEMIRGARRGLDLEEFYFSHRPGEALQPVVDAIGAAAARGVRVRIVLDAGMAKTYPWPADSMAKLANVEVRRVDYRRLGGGIQHAKFMVVDGREAWIGSQNLDWRSLSHIHEMGIRVRDRALAGAIARVFETDWAACDTTRPAAPAPYRGARWPLRLAQGRGDVAQVWLGASPRAMTPAGIPWDRDLLIERLAAARHEIVAQVLQYGVRAHGAADSTLHRALIDAAARGVRVRLVVSDWAIGGGNEPALRDLASRPNVEVRISRVPEWSGGYIPFARVEHCKFMVADSTWLWLGTSNWEPGYFTDSRNLGLTIRNAPLALQARRAFAASWEAPSAVPYTPEAALKPRVHGMEAPPGEKSYGE